MRHKQTVGLGRRIRRAETIGYLDLSATFLLAPAERNRLHEQSDELLALLEPLGRIFFDLGQAPPEREEPGVRGVCERCSLPSLGELCLDRG
jgi:hypothetical protein